MVAAIVVVVLVFAGILVWRSGTFDKEPVVEAKPDNCYEETLHVITDEDYKPYSFYGANGEFSGHDVELITMVANELGMNLDLQFMEWYDGIDAMNSDSADVLMTCDYSDSFPGVNKLIKSEPISYDEFIVYSKQKIDSVDDLYNKSIAIMKNGNVTSQIKMLGLYKRCKQYKDNRMAMQAVADGEVDCAVMRNSVGTVLLQEVGVPGIEADVSIGQSYMCFCINDNNPALARDINGAIEKLKQRGELKRLNEKWLTTFVTPYTLSEVLINNLWIVIVFVTIIALMLLYTIRSQKERLDAEAENARGMQVVDTLASDFGCVNYIEIEGEEDFITNYRTSPLLKELIPNWEKEDHFTKKRMLVAELIPTEEEKEEFMRASDRELVIEKLKDENSYFVNFRINVKGEICYYQMKFTGFKENGELKGIVVGLHSIDEQMKKDLEHQEQLQQALAMAQSASRAKTAFLNNMSHDIRTPMNAIIGFTGLAENHLDNKEQVKDYLEKIGQSSEHLLSLINDVLDMSRIESGKMNLVEKEESILDIVNGLRDIVMAEIDVKHLDFSIDCDEVKDKMIICDKLRLNQVLLNILSNAIKYTPAGGFVSMKVVEKRIRNSRRAEYRFTIKDNGMGMSKEFLETLFDPFTRVENATVSGIQGTGLGMAITKNIVDMMGGEIYVNSELEKGTEFTVDFSFALADGQEAEAEEQNRQKVDVSDIDFTGHRVLLVEDNVLNREIAIELLEEYGFVVDTADNGAIAAEKVSEAKAGDYDLILMDIQMPVMNGYEATVRIREMNKPGVSDVPILAMTANAFEEDRLKALQAGMNEHITKPIDIGKLKETLAQFIK